MFDEGDTNQQKWSKTTDLVQRYDSVEGSSLVIFQLKCRSARGCFGRDPAERPRSPSGAKWNRVRIGYEPTRRRWMEKEKRE